MKNIFLVLSVQLALVSCSDNNTFEKIVFNRWNECSDKTQCSIDLGKSMRFDWDTMCFYSAANSLEEINKDLGFELKEFNDIGDRVLFLKDGKIVYYEEWFPDPSAPSKGIIFSTSEKIMRLANADSKFLIVKKEDFFYLHKIKK